MIKYIEFNEWLSIRENDESNTTQMLDNLWHQAKANHQSIISGNGKFDNSVWYVIDNQLMKLKVPGVNQLQSSWQQYKDAVNKYLMNAPAGWNGTRQFEPREFNKQVEQFLLDFYHKTNEIRERLDPNSAFAKSQQYDRQRKTGEMHLRPI
jgi:hypothetical protein